MNKLSMINKINRIALTLLVIGVLGSMFVPVLRYMTVISSSTVYMCTLLKSRIKTGKFDPVLVLLCSASLIWIVFREFYYSPYINVFGLVIVYSFLIRSFKELTGKWNWFVLGYGSIAVTVSFLNIFIEHKVLDYGLLLLQFVIIFKFLDPILEKIGQEKRRKRLAAEAELKSEGRE